MSNSGLVYRISLIAALGGLLFGYDFVVIGGAKPFYEAYFGISGDGSAWASAWAVSSAIIGCLLGALVSGFLSDRNGRRRMLMVAAALFLLSSLATAMAVSYPMFVLARIAGGMGIGLASGISPLYISEIAPAHRRGLLVSFNQLAIVIGILAAQLINLAIYQLAPVEMEATAKEIASSWQGQRGWRWMFAAEAAPAACFGMLLFWLPPSPRWLLTRDSSDPLGLEILTRLGGASHASSVARQVQQLREKKQEAITSSSYIRLLGIGLFLAVFQQWCGINVIFNYAEELLRGAGFNLSSLMFSIVMTGTVNLAFTLIAMRQVDRWGRKPLLLFGAAGLGICYLALGGIYQASGQPWLVLGLLLLAIAIYAMTLAPVTWVLLSEIFPLGHRGSLVSICVAALWVACFLLTITFKPLTTSLGLSLTFWLYSAICFAGFVYIAVQVPETRNKSLEDIEQELNH